MSTYNPHGRAQTLLERLDAEDCSYVALLDALQAAEPDFPRKKAWHILGSLLTDELIGGVRQRYYMLPRGREVLMVLHGGKAFTVSAGTSVRVFA